MENVSEDSNYRSMCLQTLPNQKKAQLPSHNAPKSLVTQDIQGARPRYLEKPIKPRQTFYNRNDDIQKSHSRCLIPKKVSKVDKQLEIDDIAGTRTKVNKFATTRKTDPLNPHYQLPQVVLAQVPQPKFIKDSLDIDDIEGTRVKETFIRYLERTGKFLDKQPIINGDKTKKPVPKTNNYLLDVSDINMKQKDKKVKGQRCTNPLDPVYLIPAQKGQTQGNKVQYGQIQGSRPHNPKSNIVCPDFCLNVRDIDGAIPKKRKQLPSSKQMEVTGSKPETLKRGISTKRKTNPLEPKYNYLGNSEIKPSYTRPKTAAQKFDSFIY